MREKCKITPGQSCNGKKQESEVVPSVFPACWHKAASLTLAHSRAPKSPRCLPYQLCPGMKRAVVFQQKEKTTWLEEALNTHLGSSHLRHSAQQFLDCQCVPLRKWADIVIQPSSPLTAATAHNPAPHSEVSQERTWNNVSLRNPSDLKWINWAQQLTHTLQLRPKKA